MAKNYIYLIESGRKPLTKAISQKLSELDTHVPIHSAPPFPPPATLYPNAGDLAAEVAHVREDMASMRAQLDTVTRLLGAALGRSLPAHDAPTHPHKDHRHRAAG